MTVDSEEPEPGRWAVHGERAIYESPWIQLTLVDVELPDGSRFEHHVARLHRAAMTVLLDEQERALLLWRHRFVSERWGWELPGGLIDPGEDPATTAARELEEETGWRPAGLERLVTFQPMVGMVDSEHTVFVARGGQRTGEPSEQAEAQSMRWVPLSSVPGLIERGDFWNSGTLVALLHLLSQRGGSCGGGGEAFDAPPLSG